ncbi:MAG: tRNA-specific 2-thiouridylase [Oscillospiraceae bacterium]
MKGTVVLGFSGGVDSACAAALLRREGWDVRALYLENGSGEAEAARAAPGRWASRWRSSTRARSLKIRLPPLCGGLCRGETPSPCVLCNPAVKLRLLCEYADALGAKYIATGHYARAGGGALYMGRPENDQSYMLCRILPGQLSRLMLPLGGMIKTETRALAASLGLPVAQKPDSMELCFVPGGDYAAWLEQRGDAPEPGDIIYNGRAVARHGGIHRFTLGQRRGLGYAAGKRVYVSEIRPATGEVARRRGRAVLTDSRPRTCAGWSRSRRHPSTARCVRHSRTLTSARACPEGGGRLRTRRPPSRPTPGQTAAIYSAGRVLGGGFIERDTKDTI